LSNDRTVSVRLQAITGSYNAQIAASGKLTDAAFGQASVAAARASSETEKLGSSATKAGAAGKTAGTAISTGMSTAATSATKARGAVAGLVTELGRSEKKRQALNDLGNAFGLVGLAAGAAFGISVYAAANFDQAMSNVAAATHESAANMDLLRQASIEAGQATQFSATEAAGAVENLAKAGVSTADILGGGLTGALNLAAAGGLDVAEAAEDAATAMTQFGLAGSDVPHIADLLAAAAGKAQGDVSDLAMALKQSGLVANQTGLSIEETTGALAAFASAGLIGSDAGTSLKTMLQALTPTSAKAKALMEQLGISAYDSQGNFIGLANYAGVLRHALAGMSAEQQNATLKTLFGSDAVRAATVLYDQGAGGIQRWIDKVNDSGYAAETAAIKMDNLFGDVEKLKGALETAFIGSGSGEQTPIREMVQDLTALTDAYNQLPPVVKGGLSAVTGFVAIMGLGVFAATRLATGLGSLNKSLTTLGSTSATAEGGTAGLSKSLILIRAGALAAGIGLKVLADRAGDSHQSMQGLLNVAGDAALGFAVGGPWGAAIGAGIGLLQLFGKQSEAAAAAQADLADVTSTVASTLDQQTGAITQNTVAYTANRLATQGAYDAATALGISQDLVTKAALGSVPAVFELNRQLTDIGNKGDVFDGIEPTELGKSLILLSGIVGRTAQGIGDASTSTKQAASAQDSLGGATDDTTGSMQAQITTAKGLATALAGLNSTTLDARSTARDWEAAIDDATKALKANGKTLNTNKAAGRANQAALDGMANAAIAHAAAMAKDGQSLTQVNGYLKDARAQLVATARQFGMSKPAADAYANAVLRVPANVRTKVQLDGVASALAQAEALVQKLFGLDGQTATVHVNYELATYGSAPGHIGIPGNARGGMFRGRGTGTSDSNLTAISDGEFIVNSRQTARHRQLLEAINAGSVRAMARGGLAGQGIGAAISAAAGGEEMSAEQLAHAIAAAFAQFGFGKNADASKVAGEIRDLKTALRAALGKDAPILDRLDNLGDRLVDAAKAGDKLSNRLQSLEQAQNQYAATVAASFRHDIFGGGASGLLTQLRADTNDASAMNKALHRAKAKGLSGGLFKAVAASGDLETAQQLAGMSRAEIRQYERAYRRRQRETSQLGDYAGNQVFGEAIHGVKKELAHLNHTIKHLENVIEHLPGHVEHGAHKGTKEGARDGTREGARDGMREQGRRAAHGAR
jgi:TP901 family phage tail tape measure protein